MRAVTLTARGSSATNPAATGNILPSSRKTFAETSEYTITLTLQDSLETTTITAKLPSAKFIIYSDSGGDRLGFMKVANKTIPTGKTSTVEFSGDSQIYIGDSKLESVILSESRFGRYESLSAGTSVSYTFTTSTYTRTIFMFSSMQESTSGMLCLTCGTDGTIYAFKMAGLSNIEITTSSFGVTIKNNGSAYTCFVIAVLTGTMTKVTT